MPAAKGIKRIATKAELKSDAAGPSKIKKKTEILSTRDTRVLFFFQFKKGLSAAAAAREINLVFGLDTCNERTVRRWFTNFSEGNFDLENEPRGRPTSSVNDEELRAEVERNSSTTLQCLAETLDVSIATISRHLGQIGKVKTRDRWVPHESTEANKLQRLQKKETTQKICKPKIKKGRSER